jgi:tRNA(adenine34) deaminase
MTQQSKDLAFMAQALQLAKIAASHGEVPVGAVVVLGDTVVAAAANEKEGGASALAHAELLALQRASEKLGRWRLTGCTLYVTLEPCVMCAGALVQARVDRVVYGCADPKAGAVHSLYQILTDPRLNHRPAVEAGVLKGPCSQVLKEFFALRRRALAAAN